MDSYFDELCQKVRAEALKGAPPKVKLAISFGEKTEHGWHVGGAESAEMFYSASVVKAYYAYYAAILEQEGKLKISEPMMEAMTDMIVDSNNDATGYVLDVLSGTTSGPELPAKQMKEWIAKRLIVQDFFRRRGYENLVACMKTWNEGAYGREKEARFAHGMRNHHSTGLAVKLLSEIELLPSTHWLRKLMHRDVLADNAETSAQSKFYTGAVLPPKTLLWSKAGWTSEVTHDAALFTLPNGRTYALAICTSGSPENQPMIRSVAAEVLKAIK